MLERSDSANTRQPFSRSSTSATDTGSRGRLRERPRATRRDTIGASDAPEPPQDAPMTCRCRASGRSLEGDRTCRRRTTVARAGSKRWSLYGGPGCNRWQRPQMPKLKNGDVKPKPLPRVATGCQEERMVRRGSAVRVRQRALQSPCKRASFLSAALAESATCIRYGGVYGASRFRTASSSRN